MTKSTLSANGSTTAVQHNGGTAFLAASGTFGSGTLRLEFSPDNGTTYIATGVSLTAAGRGSELLPTGVLVRATLTGATAPSLSVWVQEG